LDLELGSCFRDALRDANIIIPQGLSIPDWIQIEEIPTICADLDLKWFGDGNLEIGIEPVIVLYRTRKGKGHAVLVPDIGPLLDRVEIVGVIRLVT
jgi:hypothetical protein